MIETKGLYIWAIWAGPGRASHTIRSIKGEFSVKDLQQRCPAVGIDLIRRILRQEREAARIECLGRGPDARWKNK
jgi:hypothetical protein